MMSDIRGFTTPSERLQPAQVVTLINRYLGAMTDIIMAHQGTIDEFIGDAILAVFGAPQRRDDDADRAARCALAMQAAMDGINAQNRAEGLPEIQTGIVSIPAMSSPATSVPSAAANTASWATP